MPSVVIKRLTKRFGDVAAVEGLSLDVKPGELVSLLGPSGCGKTTTLRLVAGFLQRRSVRYGWASAASRPRRASCHRSDDLPELCPWPHMTVTQNVGYGLRFKAGVSKVDRDRRVVEMLRIVELASSSESPWRGPSSWSRRFSCSTSLSATSMQIFAKKCNSRSGDFTNRLASRPST